MTSTTFDHTLERLAAGDRLSPEERVELAASPDILQLGMLADVVRRRRHGNRTTYLRVAVCPLDGDLTGIPAAAAELRITGTPASLDAAADAVARARAAAGNRTVTAFTWADVERLADGDLAGAARVLHALRAAGLDGLAGLPIDDIAEPLRAVDLLAASGFERLTLTVARGGAAASAELWEHVSALQTRAGCIQALNPLPSHTAVLRSTTGYQDVKAIAVARLAAPEIPSIQVDWLRYGPKLAQVALTFGADDVWGVSASDAAPEGRRRAPVEEIRRNIAAAGFEPAERDGRYGVAAAS